MKKNILRSHIKTVGIGLLAGVLTPASVWACACGCGVFEVATSDMLPHDAGGMAFLNYDFQDQNQNWSDSSKAPSGNNTDKEIRTSFISTGVQYMFNRDWGVSGEIPFAYRNFKTVTANPNVPDGTLASVNWFSLGDIRIHAIYTGFFDDMSAGVTAGLRLPTGSISHENAWGDVDRDSEIGSGSTDALLGGFYRGKLTSDNQWEWFSQIEGDLPMFTQADYRPGFEIDAAAGIDYTGMTFGGVQIIPIAQALGSERTKDYGADANSPNSGYTRLLLSPALEFHLHPVTFYTDVEIPVFQHANGNQLVAPVLFKLNLTYMF